jgi:hypothetical protein
MKYLALLQRLQNWKGMFIAVLTDYIAAGLSSENKTEQAYRLT